MLIPHMVIGGGIGLAAASGKNTILLEVGMIILAIGWAMIVGLVVVSVKSNTHWRRLDEEIKVFSILNQPSKPLC